MQPFVPHDPRPPIVLKFGGELIEDPSRLSVVAAAVARMTAAGRPLVIVHGGGKEIDAALKAAAIPKQQVDGLRVTDPATLAVVVAVLAGTVNTRFVSALVMRGIAAVGLTGADAGCGRAELAPPHRAVDGRLVDLGRVGIPSPDADPAVLRALTGAGFVPVVACIGLGPDGQLLNVNADTFAGHVAARLGASRLIIAGTTPGVLDPAGHTVPILDHTALNAMIEEGSATAGMVAKLRACAAALQAGVRDIAIVDGCDASALEGAALHEGPLTGTRVVRGEDTSVPAAREPMARKA